MSHHSQLISADLIWEAARQHNSFLVKRNNAGGVQFSKDPYNVMNLHSRKHAGFVNEKAVGVVPAAGEKGGVTLLTKKAGSTQKPSKNAHQVTFGGNKGTRKTYLGISNNVAKGYRGDLRQAAVARASAIRKSQLPVKESAEKKVRGSKAKKAAATEESS